VTSLIIEHQCPQCGAPAELDETDRLFRCGYCRVNSYLTTPNFFRYIIPHNAPAGKDILYFPYWRFKGMLFWCLAKGIEQRFLDVSRQALTSSHFPINIGFRGQTRKLRFASTQSRATFVKPRVPFKTALAGWTRQYTSKLRSPILHHDIIGETYSLIYAPFYLEKKVMDGVLNKPVSTLNADQIDEGILQTDRPHWPITFLATLCPQCGWDLSGSRDSLALNCTNCHTTWWAKSEKLIKLPTAHIPPKDGRCVYLPFWRIQADISPIRLRNYADLITVANLPKVIGPDWQRRPFYFWNPAFKVRPQSYLTIANNVTLNQPHGDLSDGQPKGALHAVTLPLGEAVESLKLQVAGFIKPAERRSQWVPQIRIQRRRFVLVYIPFHDGHHEFIQTDLNVAVNKNMLAHAKNL
jgi:ribosomal protein S27AE